MTHDMIIRGGSVVDGTGSDPVTADVAVDDGRISRIGDLSQADAATELDATAKIVTPGFVDIHTHLDAQVGWDPELRSSSYHGVTTALIGNCGVTFAPVSAENRRYLAELMEAVEDIAADAIMDGLPWTWTGYGEYLDAVQGLGPALNIVGLAGHSAIRFEVMGDRALDVDAQATDAELGAIAELVRQSVEEGAVGFSTSRFLGHRVPDGRCTPGTHADLRETEAIQRAVVDAGGAGGLFQAAPDFSKRFPTELAMFEKGAELGCQVLFSGGARAKGDGDVSFWEEFLGRNNDAGHRITTISHTRPSGSLFGLAQVCPFDTPAWNELMALPTIDARVERLRDPQARATLVAEAKQAGFKWNAAPLLHPLGIGELPDYDLDRKGSLVQLAEAAGQDPVDVFVERMLASDGRELLNMWMFSGFLENQWPYLKMEHCVPMLGDAGAHVGQLIDADSTTFLLSELTRDRGVFELGDAVHQITAKPARVLGLRERGEIREGWHADLNVIDYEKLATCHPEYVNDFPHGGGRFIVRSRGYDATIIGGQVVVADGEHTGSRPGEVIREFVRG
ncbi:MAG: amidohydrolase family protein [Acidimicrobiia bacterium]|nr:amidohydrolase family protein [Acidimicrobiia bacterium]